MSRDLSRWRSWAAVLLAVSPGWPGSGHAEQLASFSVHDPSKIVYDPDSNRYLVFWTGVGIPFATSPDKINWSRTNADVVFPVGHPQRADYWAPDMWDSRIHGKYLRFYSRSSFGSQTSSIRVVSAPSLTAPTWQLEGDVVTSNTGDPFNAIDPGVYYDETADRLWLSFGSFWTGIYIVEIDPRNPTQQLSGFTHLAGGRFNGSHPNNPTGQAGQNAIEGPFIFKRNDWYYLKAGGAKP